MEKFPIKEKSHEFELSHGSYQIYVTGGWYIKNLEDLNIELIDLESGKSVTLKSKDFFGLRRQAYISSQQAVLAFEFENLKYSKVKIDNQKSRIINFKTISSFFNHVQLKISKQYFLRRNTSCNQIKISSLQDFLIVVFIFLTIFRSYGATYIPFLRN